MKEIKDFLSKNKIKTLKRKEYFEKINSLFYSGIESDSFIDNINFLLTENETEIFERLLDEDEKRDYFLKSETFKKLTSLIDIDLLKLEKLKINYGLDYSSFETNERRFMVSVNANEIYDLACSKNNLVRVIRLESEEGEGVYSAKGIRVRSESAECNPSPDFDDDLSILYCKGYNGIYRLDCIAKQYYFGFNDEKEIFEWFYDEKDIQSFINKNVKVRVYEVPENLTIKSSKQIAFKKEESKIIFEYDFEELLKDKKLKRKNLNK